MADLKQKFRYENRLLQQVSGSRTLVTYHVDITRPATCPAVVATSVSEGARDKVK